MKQFFSTAIVAAVTISSLLISCKKEEPIQTEKPSVTLLSPANNSVIARDEALKSISFRWTPLVPKPREPVTYRLRVWQLMQGQNASTVMQSKASYEKEVTELTEVNAVGIYTGPCRPPYLCDFVWSVTAIITNTDGSATPITSNTGTFSVN